MQTWIYLVIVSVILLFLIFLFLIVFKKGWGIIQEFFNKKR
ncbi:hypothetical protein SAMN04487988_104122 [Algoriphagus hitonicola]|uniref:Uncharacterized protein n=1 Tax=Algoriphagus hitonicola TaxID=435880 RepID=A0A1I2SCJ1_9BACT|nr:hypothetical protein SAMN04487988_104122 [Algoriphagus hitonicola]